MVAKLTFIIYGLPRSRTFWLSQFLSANGWTCGHDQMRFVRGVDDIRSLLDMPMSGSAETGAAPFWRLIHTMRPDIRTVVIRRSVDDAIASLRATGVTFDADLLAAEMKRLDAKLDQIEARVPDVLSVPFDTIDAGWCQRISEHCTGQFDAARYEAMKDRRLVCDLAGMMRYFAANMPQIERLRGQVKQKILAQITERPVKSADMTFQEECLDGFIAGAQDLFREHSLTVGEPENSWESKNVPLLYALEAAGLLQIMTARANGRMFGYLMAVIAPALDSRSGVDATHTLFYGSPDAPGVGLKLQRASIDALRAKGVDQVALRAGTRGTGKKQDILFKRMGAQEVGRMFVLDLKEAV